MEVVFEKWRHWLEGAQNLFIVLTNHKNIEYMQGAKRLNTRQASYAVFFSCFHFSVT